MLHSDDFDADRFATLFSPPTPPATPQLLPTLAHSHPLSTDLHRPTIPPRQDSSDSLLIPTANDPLSSSVSPVREPRNHTLEFFDKFVDEAKFASERSKKLVLNELLEHEDDPLYFLNKKASNSAETDAAGPGDVQPEHTSDLTNARQTPSPLLHFNDPPADTSPDAEPNISKSLSRSYQNLGTLSSRWMTPILSSSKPIPPSASQTQPLETVFYAESPTAGPSGSSDAMSTLHAHFAHSSQATQRRFSTPQHHASRERAALLATLSHGTPFAPHPAVPPSGAPGFVDDRAWDKGFSSEYDGSTTGKSVVLEGRKEAAVEVVDKALADLIRPHLPALARLQRKWTLSYSLDQHGISLNTLYARCDPSLRPGALSPGAVVAIRDSGNTTFGAWIGDGLRKGTGGYYGGGESFLWSCTEEQHGGKRLRVYKWTGENDYVALCEPNFLSFGGGNGHFGLYIDDTLLEGTSAYCPTFANEPLCSAEGPRIGVEDVSFECVGLEVWVLEP